MNESVPVTLLHLYIALTDDNYKYLVLVFILEQ